LPDDVQAAILREPENERAVRTERALHYQELFSEDTQGADLERCQYCGQMLPVLQKPRRWFGACQKCVTEQPMKRGNSYTPEFTGTMTTFEREHYRPASQLAKGEYNPVSRSGSNEQTGQE